MEWLKLLECGDLSRFGRVRSTPRSGGYPRLRLAFEALARSESCSAQKCHTVAQKVTRDTWRNVVSAATASAQIRRVQTTQPMTGQFDRIVLLNDRSNLPICSNKATSLKSTLSRIWQRLAVQSSV